MKKLITAIILTTTILFTPLSFAHGGASTMTDFLTNKQVSFVWQSLARTLTIFYVGPFADVPGCDRLNLSFPDANVNRVILKTASDGRSIKEEPCQ